MTYFYCLGSFCLGCLYTHFRSKIHYYIKYFIYVVFHFREIQKSSYYNEFTETEISDLDFEDLGGKLQTEKAKEPNYRIEVK